MVNASVGDRRRGVVVNIQRFSVHDGPGIRDLLFIKGCPLRCLWCSNPESQNSFPEIAFSKDRCIGYDECRYCEEACPTGAITMSDERKIKIDRRLCNNCGKCAEVCPARAVRLFGEYMSVFDVIRVIEEDSGFYSRSGGGITVSGGEPLCQAEFVTELLKKCRERGIDTAIETTGYAEWKDVEKVCRYANLIFYDIKHMNSNRHKAFTGVYNELILRNIKRLSSAFPKTPVIARTPIVPGFTDSEENIEATTDFLSEIESLIEYELMPYHGFGQPKYQQLGRQYPLNDLQPPSQEQMAKLKRIAQKAIKCRAT